MKRFKNLSIMALFFFWSCVAANAQSLQWIELLGTSSFDSSEAIVLDGLGHAYTTGFTDGNLAGSIGGDDAVLCKYDSSSGTLLWVRQFGTEALDRCYGIAVDHSGNVFVTGATWGDFGGQNSGESDVIVCKFNPDGQMQWVRQFGNSDSYSGVSIAADSMGNVYVTGSTYGIGLDDVILLKYDTSGLLQWNLEFGSDGQDWASDVATDSMGNVYVTGNTNGDFGGKNIGGYDAFIGKYDSGGTQLWIQKFGSDKDDSCNGISVDNQGNVCVTGSTLGSIDGKTYPFNRDAFVCKYDGDGTHQWTRQFGASFHAESGRGVSHDASGDVYVSGWSDSPLAGFLFGDYDTFITKYDSSGDLLWTNQIGTQEGEVSNDVATDGNGNVFICGSSRGDLGGENAGIEDAFVAKFKNHSGGDITATVDSIVRWRGVDVAGDRCDLVESDDSHLKLNPGFTLNKNEAPVSYIFVGNVGPGVFDLDVEIESNAGTPNLTFTIELYNWNTFGLDVVGVTGESFNSDVVRTYKGIAEDHVETGGLVLCVVEWCATGPTINYPWEVRVDRLVWSASN